MERALVTGGAGFIGSHLVDSLVERGAGVRVLDSIEPQVHGPDRCAPGYMNAEAELVRGDVRDRETLWRCLEGVDVVFHLASAVGVGQSMYEIERYVGANSLGTAVLLDVLANRPHSVRKLVVASSMSVYGEGMYRCERCGPVEPVQRDDAELERRRWEMRCPGCGDTLVPVATTEGKRSSCNSIYAISKRDQEEMCLCVGAAYRIPTVALRFFNTYGSRQALSNPYTGAAAIFASRALNGRPPVIFEDGLQRRDFVHVSDVVQAALLVATNEAANYRAFNVGSGRSLTIQEIAEIISEAVGQAGLKPEVTHQYRKGDIRHCFADISSLEALGYRPRVRFEDGVEELAAWVTNQTARDLVEQATVELRERGLVGQGRGE